MKKKLHYGPEKKVLIGRNGMTQTRAVEVAFAKAVNRASEELVDNLCAADYWLPPLWHSLAFDLESLGTTSFGDTMNQRLLKRSKIEEIERQCRLIGAGGTFYASKTVTH
ncbi:hypothetical protein [Aestuariivirga sp.]|uniref:hypothetical protein n=1 Tax=Aestuariivirga sp. TaxID=2650926 RepID=UPI0035941F54